MRAAMAMLKRRYRSELKTSLDFSGPWQLLAATMLSAQSQDRQVNIVTKGLFKAYPRIDDFSRLRPAQLYNYIGSLGLYRGKAKHIIGAAKMLKKQFNSEVPDSMEELVKLPGVGRKTANVVLYNAFGKNEGIAIDTHCITVANRLMLAKGRNPEKIEKALMRITPKDEWCEVTHMFIALGRDVCTAKRKICSKCVLNRMCPSSDAKTEGRYANRNGPAGSWPCSVCWDFYNR